MASSFLCRLSLDQRSKLTRLIFGCVIVDSSPNRRSELIIVGGSLSGLTLALACASHGIRTTVLERVDGRQRSGAALGIDRALLLKTIGMTPDPSNQNAGFPVLMGERNAVSWSAIHGWLREQVQRRSEITLKEGCAVLNVVQSRASTTVVTADGKRITAPVVAGADGYRSVVRAAMSPEKPFAAYAGYILWRGLVAEREMPACTPWPCNDNGVALVNAAGYRLIAYPVAGADGSVEPGGRRISFTWYDPTRDALLEELRCISPVRHVLASLPRERVPKAVRCELRELAHRIWPEPWCHFIVHALEHRDVFATPVAEYLPERLRRGRLVVLGDAAHVVSPMTGRGFITGTVDAEVLAGCLGQAKHLSCEGISLALMEYENKRLMEAQELAMVSAKWSHAYLRHGNFRRAGQN